MDENKQLFYVSHIVFCQLPNKDFSKLYFYTKKDDKYYKEFDNNSFDEEYMRKLEDTKRVIKLPRLLEIEEGKRKGLWVDSEGKVYIADIDNPFSEPGLGPLEGIILK
jgi:hypothetical protein